MVDVGFGREAFCIVGFWREAFCIERQCHLALARARMLIGG